MIFCGDIAVSGVYDNLDYTAHILTAQQPIFVNLEGAICSSEQEEKLKKQRKVFNSGKVIELLQRNHVTGCILANNHIMDSGDGNMTRTILHKHGIETTGYGMNQEEAERPIYFSENGKKYALLAFGWNTIGCRYAGKKQPGINSMRLETVLGQIRKHRKSNKRVIVVFHWNYEYELYPMPMQRELAKMAIESGAELIIGCHPHCVQGVEFYNGVPIVYSLGNWMFDSGVYFDGRIVTKECGKEELVIEWKEEILRCHWYEYDKEKSIPKYMTSELAVDSDKLKKLTPFSGMSEAEYLEWFKMNRRVHKFLPVFANSNQRIRNHLFYCYIMTRERVTRKIRDGVRCLKKR